MKFMRPVTAHIFLLVFQQTWVFITDRLTVVVNSELVCNLHYLRHYSRCYRTDCCLWGMCQRISSRSNRQQMWPVISVRLAEAGCRPSCRLFLSFIFETTIPPPVSVFVGSNLCRTLYSILRIRQDVSCLRLKHKENLLWFVLSRTHWLSCNGFCFICSFCMKSSSKRVPILFYTRATMLVLGGPTTFRGVSNKKGGPVALPRKVLKYYTL